MILGLSNVLNLSHPPLLEHIPSTHAHYAKILASPIPNIAAFPRITELKCFLPATETSDSLSINFGSLCAPFGALDVSD